MNFTKNILMRAPYLPPTAQDAQTIEDEIKKKKCEFFTNSI